MDREQNDNPAAAETEAEHDLDQRIARVLAGESSSADAADLRKWFTAQGIDVTSARIPGSLSNLPRMPRIDINASFAATERRIGGLNAEYNGKEGIVSLSNSNRRTPHWAPAIGIGLAALLFSVIGTQWKRPFTDGGQVATSSAGRSMYSTDKGERATITLPDGSIVTLSVDSRLEVPADFNHTNRTIRLSGAARFSVTHHSGKPFTVVTGASTTRVLGTTFSVRQYATDSVATIGVRDGKVAVGTHVLSADQQVSVRRDDSTAILAASPNDLSFAEGVLILNDLPMPDAIIELNRWYNADIRINDSDLRTQRITGTFAIGSLTDLTEILQLTGHRVERDGRNITLYRK